MYDVSQHFMERGQSTVDIMLLFGISFLGIPSRISYV